LIAENQFLINSKLLEAHSNHDEYLLYIRAMTELAPSADDDDEDGEKIKDIKDITSETRHNIETLREELNEFKKQVEAALANK
jgi:thiamine kinase-like enzyme